MILTFVLILLAIILIYASAMAYSSFSLGLSLRQSLLYAPLKLTYRIRDREIRDARKASAPVIYVVTHQSRLDPALMLALLPEDTLHILDPVAATSPWLEPFREMARTIPFKPEHVFVSRRLVRVLRGKGRLAVYIPESVEPETRPFRLYRAVARIAVQANASIVPIFVGGSGDLSTTLAPERGKPARFLPRLSISALPAMTIEAMIDLSGNPAASPTNTLFDRVAEARLDATTRAKSLFSAIRDAALRFGPDRAIVEDAVGGDLSYKRMMIGARIFAGRFARMTAPGEIIGIMLPNTGGVAVSLIGLWSAGRTAALINYTSGPANITSAIATALMRTVISSRAFIEKAGLAEEVKAAEAGGAKFVWLEDLRAGISSFDKASAAVLWRYPVARQKPEAPAVVMFTSGSDAAPKAIVLSHRNLMTNAMQVEARIAFGVRDRLMNVLPVFHSFGLTGGLILPIMTGVKVLLYPSPLHYKAIPAAAAKFQPTVLIGTDTFLAAYANAAKDTEFKTVRLAVAGAEPVRTATRELWRERFDVRIFEGFGMTEAGPVVAVNTTTHGRDGSVGRPMPGLRIRLEPVEGIADAGRMWISGPNVMLGMMTPDQPGVLQPLASGWHDSGDIVAVDREGFLTIRGRARRFAKIAGEMISLSVVETLAASLWPDGRHAAVSVPDKKRGEKIVLVSTAAETDVQGLRAEAKRTGVPALAVPETILPIDELPMLATGKTDYAAVRQFALDRLGLAAAA